MKTWKIPVVWQEEGFIEIEAQTLGQALKIADICELTVPDDGEYVLGTLELLGASMDYIRDVVNDGQEDEQELKPVIYAEWFARNGDLDHPERYCTNCKAAISRTKSLYYKFCPECGATMRAKKEKEQ
jgi:predicted RNA-binding Zn-ribbon protein involved in translation (DUF1610 family)